MSIGLTFDAITRYLELKYPNTDKKKEKRKATQLDIEKLKRG